MTIKVLQVLPRVVRRDEITGGERYPNELISALRQQGGLEVSVSAVCPDRSIVNVTETGAHDATFRSLLAQAKRADVIHVQALRSLAFDASVVLSQVTRTPLVLTDHGGGWPKVPSRALGPIRKYPITGIAAVSRWSSDIDLAWMQPRPTAILHGGGEHVLREEGNAITLEMTDFLYVGRLLPHKGVHVLIEALPEHATLRIVGRPNHDSAYFETLQRLSLGKNVEFLNGVSDGELPSLYRSSRYFVLPSVGLYKGRTFRRPELLGLVVLEAIACGTPAIGSDIAGLGETLDRLGMPSAIPGDVASWSALLHRLLNDPAETTRLRAKTKDVAGMHTWRQAAESCLDLYTTLPPL